MPAGIPAEDRGPSPSARGRASSARVTGSARGRAAICAGRCGAGRCGAVGSGAERSMRGGRGGSVRFGWQRFGWQQCGSVGRGSARSGAVRGGACGAVRDRRSRPGPPGAARGRSRPSFAAPAPGNYFTRRNNSAFSMGMPHFKRCARERYSASLACSPADG